MNLLTPSPPLSVSEGLTSLLKVLHVDVADLGAWLTLFGAKIVLIWLMAFVGYRVLVVVAARVVAAADDGDDTRLSDGEKRAQTIAQLLRSVGRIVAFALAALMTLSLFIDVAPLLAGAGILGLAVSFGAQSLVKDVISGFFILLENQFAVGDVIEAGGKTGTVERMTLRVVMLRDLEGTLHIVPNGQMTTVSNRTRGWSGSVLDIGVAYDSDIDHTLEVLANEATLLSADSTWGPKLITPPEVNGVQSFGDNAVSIRVQIRTLPGMQYEVTREFRRRIKNRLDEEGIEIPFPQRTVHVRHHGEPTIGAEQSAIDEAAGAA